MNRKAKREREEKLDVDRDLTDRRETPKFTERRVTYQHEDTGNIFTKLIPANEPIPEFPRRFIVSVKDV